MSHYDSMRAKAVTALIAAREALGAEITTYPTPISGCDAQFNHLLAERESLGRALGALRADIFVPTPPMPAPADRLESR